MDLTATHARALATMQRNQAPAVTFTLTTPGTQVPTTGRHTSPSTTSVSGYGIRMKGEASGYEAGESTRTTPVKIFFVPSTFGQVPPQDSATKWESRGYRVKGVEPVSPTGTAVGSFVTLVP